MAERLDIIIRNLEIAGVCGYYDLNGLIEFLPERIKESEVRIKQLEEKVRTITEKDVEVEKEKRTEFIQKLNNNQKEELKLRKQLKKILI